MRSGRRRWTPIFNRFKFVYYIFILLGMMILARLFTIQVLNQSAISRAVLERRQTVLDVLPQRGEVFIGDDHGRQEVPAIMNQTLYTVFVVPAEVKEPKTKAKQLAELLHIDPTEVEEKLERVGEQYVSLKRRVPEATVDQINAQQWKGVYSERYLGRAYPEGEFLASITGFAKVEEREIRGQYGIERFFNAELSGQKGWQHLLRDGMGRLIPLPGSESEKAQNGINVVLTIDRTVQFEACEGLKKTVADTQAEGGSVIVMDPFTGDIRALCNTPSYDPEEYSEVKNLGLFNNRAVDEAYEPGSVIKVITMAAGLEEGVVTPTTTFTDLGYVRVADHTIRNAADKVYGRQNMVGVLKESINTGAVFVADRLGKERLQSFFGRVGFGQPTNIELPNEHPGTIASLKQPGFIYAATASFGQGMTVTALQLARAVSAIANGGMLVTPTLIKEFRTPDDITLPRPRHERVRIFSAKTSTLLSGMMAEVVEEGHSKRAGVAGYYLAGKTGTAQVAEVGRRGYSGRTNHTFVGFGPVDRPRFVIVIRIINPKALYAESTAVPLAGSLNRFIFSYDRVAPTRSVDEP